MSKKIPAVLATAIMLMAWCFPVNAAVIDGTPMLPDYVTVEEKTMSISIRGIPTNITATIYTNENASKGVNVALWSGYANNGKGYEWTANELPRGDGANLIHRVIVPDLPGHGLSDAPIGVPFSLLNFNDYKETMKGVHEVLRAEGIIIDYDVVHSMADPILSQLMQEVNLKEYGVKAVIGIAGVPLRPVDWTWLTNGGLNLNEWLTRIVLDPYNIPYVSFDTNPTSWEGWRNWLFVGKDGKLSKDYPSENKVKEYMATEPLLGVTLPLIRMKMVSFTPPILEPDPESPTVIPGTYANGPARWDICPKNDPVVLWQNCVDNHRYLTQQNPEIYEWDDNLETGQGEIKKGGVVLLNNEVHSFFLVSSGAKKLSHQIVKIIKKTEKEKEG